MRFATQGKPDAKWLKINRRLVQELSLPEHPPIQLVAQATGWGLVSQATSRSFGIAWVQFRPMAVLFQRGAQRQTISITDPSTNTIRTLAVIAFMISTLCWLIMALTNRRVAQTTKGTTQVDPAEEKNDERATVNSHRTD